MQVGKLAIFSMMEVVRAVDTGGRRAHRGITIKPREASQSSPEALPSSPQRHRHRAQRVIAIEPRGITIEPTEASPSSPEVLAPVQWHRHRAYSGINTIELTAASTPSSLEASASAQRHWHQPRGISISPEALASTQWHRHRAHSGINTSSATGSNHPPQHQRTVFRTSFIGGAIAPSSLHDIH
jgi:hypothetical protein